MIKNFKQYNESLRDKMTPKPIGEMKDAILNLLNNNYYNVNNFVNTDGEYEKIAKILNCDLDDLLMINKHNEHYNLIYDLLTPNDAKYEHGIQINTSEGVWDCYKNKNYAIWTSADDDDFKILIANKKHIKKILEK